MSLGGGSGRLLEGLRQIAMPVAVVAAASHSERGCATATVMYVSIDPPMVGTSLGATSSTLRLVREVGSFCVSLLSAAQRDIARTAARRSSGPDKVADLGIQVLTEGPAAGLGVAGALAVLVCQLVDLVGTGDHRLCIGTVHDSVLGDPGSPPLVRVRRAYASIDEVREGDVDRTYPI